MKTIVIIENEDGTEKIIMYNMNGEGEEVIIPRAKTKFDLKQEREIHNYCQINLNISCYSDERNKLYTIKSIQPKLSNKELVSELKSRLSC